MPTQRPGHKLYTIEVPIGSKVHGIIEGVRRKGGNITEYIKQCILFRKLKKLTGNKDLSKDELIVEMIKTLRNHYNSIPLDTLRGLDVQHKAIIFMRE